MEEEKKARPVSGDAKEPVTAVKPSEAKDGKEKKERGSIRSVAGVYRGEFEKIIWPSREDLIKQTFTVIVTSLMFGAIIASMDYLFSFCYRLLATITI